ncbi:MAG TPA: transcriptional regulator [Pseudolabrys sp.]|nr:transcriptional regulator [Pseudolabrys sp.]
MTTLKRDPQLSAADKKAERDRDAAQAMQDYESEKRATQANMARLRALRLAKERADAQAAAAKPAKRK